MARTRGHGNPNWSRDETVLALNLYFELDGRIPDKSDEKVIALSQLLRQLPYHQGAKKTDSFRNPDGVVFKLQNLKKCATGRGLDHSSSTDKAVWEELGASPHQAHDLASLIRQAAKEIGDEPIKIEEFEFIEGRIVTAVHLRRERNPRVRDKFIESRRQSQSLNCDMCDAGSPALNPRYAAAHFETHHIVPLADAGERVTKPRDLALLCANCHRLLHRAIAQERRWLSVAEAKSICMV